MKFHTYFKTVILTLHFTVFAAENIEPPLGYTLIINGVEKRVILGSDLQIQGNFTNPTIKIVPDKEREFLHGGFSFKYPSYFTFESDIESDKYKNWTMSGNDFKIMIFKVKGIFTPESYARDIGEPLI
jgi:hypothetical protein